MQTLVLDAIRTETRPGRTTVRYEYDPSGELARFFSSDPFFVSYESDVSAVPDAILAIPWLANVCPVAWVAGADVEVPTIDATFHESLRRVQEAMASLYPELVEGGAVRADEVVHPLGDGSRYASARGDGGRISSSPEGLSSDDPSDPTSAAADPATPANRPSPGGAGAEVHTSQSPGERPPVGDDHAAMADVGDGRFDESALLFTGGVDSLTTYIRHRSEDPYLISMNGADTALDDRETWRRNRAIVESFADDHGLEPLFVETDMHGFLDGSMLRAHYARYLDSTWWASVQHGLGLSGICAPLAYEHGIGDLYIAATHTSDFGEAWGSHPAIDNQVAWSGTRTHHDGYELSRQQKIERIAQYVDAEAPGLTIRSCHSGDGGGNCSRCEKCARTIFGLMLAGLDPERHGYEVDDASFETFRERFEAGDWRLGADERFMWQDLKDHLDPDAEYPHEGAAAFAEWLASTDLDELVDRSADPVLARYARLVGRNVPLPVYRLFVPVYARLRRLT